MFATRARRISASALIAIAVTAGPGFAQNQTTAEAFTVQVTAFQQTVAQAASEDRELASYYRANDFRPIWTGAGEPFITRRRALLTALNSVSDHGLPTVAYDVPGVMQAMRAAHRQTFAPLPRLCCGYSDRPPDAQTDRPRNRAGDPVARGLRLSAGDHL